MVTALAAAAPAAPPELEPKQAKQHRQVMGAARKLEGVMLQQLLKVMWQSSPVAGAQGEMYRGLFESALADHLAQGGGIGLAPMIERALEGRHGNSPAAPEQLTTVHRAAAPGLLTAGARSIEPRGEPGVGEVAALQVAAASLLQDGGARWGRDGALLPQDLQSDIATDAAGADSQVGAHARFSVRDANGYQGYYKCNLFAFELARRAGFEVPVVARAHGWGFPTSGRVTQDAQDGALRGDWAKVVTGQSAAQLDGALRSGQRALMLSGAGHGDRLGHMAVVERVHSVDYGPDGALRRIVFDGWEARPDGARHLRQRTWNAYGNPGGNDPRNGFDRIEVLELQRPPEGARPEQPLSGVANPSRLDDSASSHTSDRPIQSSEAES